MVKACILFLAANPRSSDRLALDEELRAIEERLNAAKHRDAFHCKAKWAVRPDDLQDALLREEPTVVHFSGHGAGELGIILHDDDGDEIVVPAEALRHLFSVLKGNIRLVVLNACYSDEQARAIAREIDFVVGMKSQINDVAARKFAGSFYRALGFGRSIKTAFDLGVSAIKLHGVGDDSIPVFIVKSGSNAEATGLVPVEQPGAPTPQAADNLAVELSAISRAVLLAGGRQRSVDNDLRRSLFEVEAVLARSPHNVEARLLRERIETALERDAPRARSARGDMPLSSEELLSFELCSPVRSAPSTDPSSAIDPSSPGVPSLAEQDRLGSPPQSFIGRARELSELTRQVGPGGILLWGPDGMGKKALALALAEALKPRYPDWPIAVDLKGASANPLSAGAAMREVARAFLPAAPLPDGPEELTALYQAILEGRRALVLIDALDRGQIEPLLPPAGCALIITSRLQISLSDVYSFRIDKLNESDARGLLRSLAPRLDAAAAGKLAELCGGHPFVVRLAGSALFKRPDLSPGVYAERLLEALEQYEPVEAALSVSLDLVDPVSRILWPRLALLAPSFSDAESITQLSSSSLLLQHLADYALLERDPMTELYSLPRAARGFAMSSLTEADRIETKNALSAAGDDRSALERREWLFGEDLDNALLVARRTGYRRAELFYLERKAEIQSDLPSAAEAAEQALAISRELGDRSSERRMLDRLVVLYERLNDGRRAVEAGEQVLGLARQGGNRRDEMWILSKLVLLHESLSDHRRAAELAEQNLAVLVGLGDQGGERRALEDLGRIYDRLQDDRRAIAVHERRLAVAEAMHLIRERAHIARHLSSKYETIGEIDKAIAMLEICVTFERAMRHKDEAARHAAEIDRLRALTKS